jgi:serine/threonine-protein kinase
MSPEQEMGTAEIDGRSDLFALGAILFECLVGEPPPPRTASGAMRAADVSAVRLDSGTQKAAALVPAEWRAIIEKATAAQPGDRYPDAREFAHALKTMGEQIAKADATI